MSVINDIRGTLDTMGVEQQACVFSFLISYPLTLGGLFERRGRRVAAGVATVSGLAFIVFTDPWVHAVLLVVVALGGMGLFIAAVQLSDWASRALAWRRLPRVAMEPMLEVPALPVAPERERLPLGGATVPLKL